MNAGMKVWGIAGLVGGGLFCCAAHAGGFDSHVSGVHSEVTIGEARAPMADPAEETTATPVSAVISTEELARDEFGYSDGGGWEQEYQGLPVMEAPCPGGPSGHCPERRASQGTLNRVLLPVDPRWEAQVDALMLWQGNIASRPLYVLDGTSTTALNANQAQTPLIAGPRFGLFLNLDPVYSIEGNYFNVQSFGGEPSTVPTAAAYAMNNLAGYSLNGVDWARVSTSGQIQSAELNWRRRTCGPITWLAGFRWVEWNQEMELLDLYQGGADQFRTVTGNNLYGGQAGMDLCLWNNKNGPIRMNGVGKAGVFYNKARQTTMADVGSGLVGAAALADQTSFFGEVGLNASVRLTDWLSWRAGYSVFWLSCVATPAEQLSVTNLNTGTPTALINTNGSVLLHGVTTGLEARW